MEDRTQNQPFLAACLLALFYKLFNENKCPKTYIHQVMKCLFFIAQKMSHTETEDNLRMRRSQQANSHARRQMPSRATTVFVFYHGLRMDNLSILGIKFLANKRSIIRKYHFDTSTIFSCISEIIYTEDHEYMWNDTQKEDDTWY